MTYSVGHEHREQLVVYENNKQIGMVVQNVTQTKNWAPGKWFGIFLTSDEKYWTIGPFNSANEALKKVEIAHSKNLPLRIWMQYPQDFVE